MDNLTIYKEAFEKMFSENAVLNSHDSAGFIKSVAKASEFISLTLIQKA